MNVYDTIYVAAEADEPVGSGTSAQPRFFRLVQLLADFARTAFPSRDQVIENRATLVLDLHSARTLVASREIRDYLDNPHAGKSAYNGPNATYGLPSHIYGFPVRVAHGREGTVMLAYDNGGPYIESPVL